MKAIKHLGVVFNVEEEDEKIVLTGIVTDPVPSTVILPNNVQEVRRDVWSQLKDVEVFGLSAHFNPWNGIALLDRLPKISTLIISEDGMATRLATRFYPTYTGEDWDRKSIKKVVIPSTVTSIAKRCFEKLDIDEIVFNGHLPLIENDAFNKCSAQKVVLNDTINTVDHIPHSIIDLIEQDRDRRYRLEEYSLLDFRGTGKIVFGTPSLCEEESSIPGYIKVTALVRNGTPVPDVGVEINCLYITYLEDVTDITKTKGTLIHLVRPMDGLKDIIVFEPREMVAEKIKRAMGKIDSQTFLSPIKELIQKK